MKVLLILFKMLLLAMVVQSSNIAQAQFVAEGINYQAVLRDAGGNLLNNEDVVVRVGIISGSMTGTLVYEEDHFDTTSTYGLSSFVIGLGTTTGTGTTSDFTTIDWGASSHYVNIQIDINNTGTFVDVSTSQFFAVPYALHSKTSDQQYNLSGLQDVDTAGLQVGQTLTWDGSSWIASGIDTVNYASTADSAMYADTASYAAMSGGTTYCDTASYAHYGDTANYSAMAGWAATADSSTYSDTAGFALNSVNGWSRNGNSLTGTEFLGSTNAEDLVFRTDNTERMRITSAGKIGINTGTPTAQFEVVGDDGFMVTSNHGAGTSQTMTGSRMVWYPKKSHFYVGGGTVNLHDGNTGNYTFGQGYNSTTTGDYSVAMGNTCTSLGECSFAVGFASRAVGDYSFAQGQNSDVTGECAIGMGRLALSRGLGSVALGYHPWALADHAVAIGHQVEATDTSSFAFGYRASSQHKGAFVYSDRSTTSPRLTSTADNQFLVRAAGGTWFYSAADLSAGVNLPAGGGAWTSVSDSTKKENFQDVDYAEVLAKLDQLEVTEWNYKTQNDDVRHIGPMAQDFYALFGYGESDTTITTIDIDGVNMAALKGLIEKAESLEKRNQEFEALQAKYDQLKAEKVDLIRRLDEIEATVSKILTSDVSETNSVGLNTRK